MLAGTYRTRATWPADTLNSGERLIHGDPGPIRTGDLPLRRGTLYPAELRGHWQLGRIPRLAEWTKPRTVDTGVNVAILSAPTPLPSDLRHMMTLWESLSALGDSRALLPLAVILALFLPATYRTLLWRWTAVIAVVASVTLASKIAFMGWGLGVKSWDFTGISGHAAMSSTLYPVVCWLLASGRSRHPGAWAIAGAVLAVAIAWSRVPLRAHSLSEIIIGLGIGFAASLWVLRGVRLTGMNLALRAYAVLLAIAAAVAAPALLADLHTHDVVKAAAKALSGRERALERDDLRGSTSPVGNRH